MDQAFHFGNQDQRAVPIIVGLLDYAYIKHCLDFILDKFFFLWLGKW